jgi:predicted phosphodiesterase
MDKSILVIPDPHDEVDVPDDRFEWAGNLIVSKQPDTIVCLGDGTSLDSLSSYDIGTAVAEGRRYNEDIESFKKAMKRLHKPINDYNKISARRKKKKYKPELVYCLGNHEMRIPKAINRDPKLIGTMHLNDLQLKESGWKVYSMTEPAEVYGIAFSHYFTSGVMGRPIGGVNHARAIVQKTFCSAVVGHTHTRSFYEEADVYGNKIIGLVAGCYFDHKMSWTTEIDRYWSGLIILSVEDQEVNPEFISMKKIQRRYS